MARGLLLLVFLCLPCLGFGQETGFAPLPDSLVGSLGKKFVLNELSLQGNKKTKAHIILRELSFREGDTLTTAQLNSQLEKSRERLINTRLFVDANFQVLSLAEAYDSTDLASLGLALYLKEEWYIFPNPIFELSDRNFNEWWNNFDRDLNRVNYGIRYTQLNMRGRNETLKLVLQHGFTRKYELFYTFPYINKAQKLGMKVMGSFSTNKDVAFATEENKLAFMRDSSEYATRSRLYTGLELNWRPQYYGNHTLTFRYDRNTASGALVDSNQGYFLNGDHLQEFLNLKYIYTFDKRDIQGYPLSGYVFSGRLEKRGLGVFNDVDITTSLLRWSQYFPLPKGFNFSYLLATKGSFPYRQPYNLYQGLGFGQIFVRGYERYVVDARNFLLFKSTFKFRLLHKVIPIYTFGLLDSYESLPFELYPTAYFDAGYAHNRLTDDEWNNSMANRPLYGYGLGVDLVLYHDQAIRLEYSFNHLNEGALKIHFRAAM